MSLEDAAMPTQSRRRSATQCHRTAAAAPLRAFCQARRPVTHAAVCFRPAAVTHRERYASSPVLLW